MNIFTVLLEAVTLIVCIAATSGCGKEGVSAPVPTPTPTEVTSTITNNSTLVVATVTPTPTATPTVTPTATPNPTTVTYIFQAITICSFLHTWNPLTVTIKTYANSGNGPSYYLLRYDGAFIVHTGGCENGCPSPDTTFTRSDIHGVVCTFTVTNGHFSGVSP